MPIDKMKNGTYRVRSYVSGKRLKTVYKTRAAAVKAASTSKRRSQTEKTFSGKTLFGVDDKIRKAGYTPFQNTGQRVSRYKVTMKGFKLKFIK